MNSTATPTAAVRQRLQLALGSRAELGEELPAVGCRAFRAMTRDDGVVAKVTIHPAPPQGPDPEQMRVRVSALLVLGHGAVDLPIAAGDLGGHAWVMEPESPLPSARDRLMTGPLPLAHGVAAIRDLCRAVAAIHRRGITHGSIDLDTVRISVDGARLGGTGCSLAGSERGDLDALGEVGWALLSGEAELGSDRPLSQLRRGVSPGLDALCAALRSPDPRRRPQRAEAILELLDAVPTLRSTSPASIVDLGMHDGRPRRAVAWLIVGAAGLLLLGLLQSRL